MLLAPVVLALVLGAPPVRAAEPGITRSQADEILAELKKIRELLEKGAAQSARQPAVVQAPAASEKVTVALRDSNALGSDDAPITMIEFADYQCPFCRSFHSTTFGQIQKNFVETGKLRYVSRDLPLPIHAQAPQAARAARCAGDQHKFWELRHLLITNQDKLGREDVLGYAQSLNMDVPAFTVCVDSKRYDALVQQDSVDANDIGVMGTPTFVLGKTNQKGRFEGVKIVGAQPYAVFDAKIKELLEHH